MKVKVRQGLIKELRNTRAWTQEQLAEFSHVHSRTIQRMENDGMASLQSLHRVAKALEVDPDTLEFSTETIDFAPLLVELRTLSLAIARKLMPGHDRNLPNSFVALIVALSFGASFTFMNAVLLISSSLEHNLDNPVTLAAFGLAFAFSTFFLATVLPLFRLKTWARTAILGICWVFFTINSLLLAGLFLGTNNSSEHSVLEYLYNLAVTLWIYRVLTRADVRLLFDKQASSDPPDTVQNTP